MPTEEHTAARTSLGLVLQHLVEDALAEQGISFKANVGYHSGFIKPDVLVPGNPPKFSVHVTATGPDDSFRMKKWRYIDEVLQMRSVWGNKFVAINVLFRGAAAIDRPPATTHKGERR
jgi:hypothetical protein